MSSPSSSRVNLVIVGAGSGGASVAQLARKLSATHNITLIDQRPYAILLPATLRMVVSDVDDIKSKALVPLDKIFSKGEGNFVLGTVTSVNPAKSGKGGSVSLKSGETIDYDILVLAVGSIWGGPNAFPESPEGVTSFINESHEKYAKAQSIAIVGGGSVGYELAGEIKDIWPKKEVTIIHGGDKLLNATYKDSVRTSAASQIEARGVKLILGEFVDDLPTSGTFATRKGTKITADLIVPTRGPRPNSSLFSTFAPEALSADGYVKTEPTLQVIGYPDIFVLGDILDWKEQKQAGKCPAHAAVVVGNIKKLHAGKPLGVYKGSLEMIVVTNGKNGGFGFFGILWGLHFGAWFARMVKSKTLLLGMARGGYGYST